MPDAEIHAMSQTAEILQSLDEEARIRVLDWLAARFDHVGMAPQRRSGGTSGSGHDSESFDDFAGFFAACSPTTDEERVLVSAYWIQEEEGESQYYSIGVNQALREMGYAVSEVSKVFKSLIDARPQLALQVSKSGGTKQARKQYRLTAEGKKVVEGLLRRE